MTLLVVKSNKLAQHQVLGWNTLFPLRLRDAMEGTRSEYNRDTVKNCLEIMSKYQNADWVDLVER